jgi:calcium-dependent protein kinase
MLKEIGSGSYGRVYKVKSKTSGDTRACKQLAKGRIANMEKFTLEINVMIQMDHPNIIKLYEVYEDNRYIYLIMEECTGGELFDRIIDRINNKNLFTEKEAAEIFKQMMSAINYCHSQGICHRDLKPENLLFLNTSDDSPLKVIDFGLSKIFSQDDHKMDTKVGTAYYVSPEVLKGDYDEKCDVWSSGVILYIILTGDPPFNGANDNEIYRKIQQKKFSFPSPQWDKISDDVKDLIKKMLSDPADRLTAGQVLQHTWVVNQAPNSQDVVLSLSTDSLKNYKNANKLKRAVLTFIASRLKDEDIKQLKDIFNTLDKNKDGTLTLEEIKEGVSLLKDNTLNVEEIFSSIDTDGSGVINYTEFLAATIDQKVYLKEERLYEAFKAFDKDGSGKISVDEIKTILKGDENENKKFEELVKTFDTNGDGEIDYNEFIVMMSKTDV